MKLLPIAVALVVLPLFHFACGGGGGGGGNNIIQPPPPGGNTGTVRGQVVPGGGLRQASLSTRAQAVVGFRVFIQDTDLSAPVNADGTFRIDNVPAGPQVVSIIGSGNGEGAHVVVNVSPGRETETGPVVPRPTGLIAGIVNGLNAENNLRPLQSARVVATPLESTAERFGNVSNGRPHLVARTNANGEYVIHGALAGSYLLTARHRGFIEGTQIVEVIERRTTAADFVLESAPERTGTVRGIVRTVVEGQTVPLGEVFVALHSDQPPPPPPPGGGGGVRPLNPEDHTVAQIADSLPPAPAGDFHGLRIHSSRTRRSHPFIERRPLFTFSGADGRFEISGVPVGRYVAFFYREGFSNETRPVIVETDQVVELEVTLRDISGRIVGQVSDRNTRQPIAGAHVFAFRNDPFIIFPGGPNGGGGFAGGGTAPPGSRGQINAVPPTAGGIAVAPPARSFAETDSQGRYTLLVEEGPQIVFAGAERYHEETREANVGAQQTVTVNFELAPAPPGDEPSIFFPNARR